MAIDWTKVGKLAKPPKPAGQKRRRNRGAPSSTLGISRALDQLLTLAGGRCHYCSCPLTTVQRVKLINKNVSYNNGIITYGQDTALLACVAVLRNDAVRICCAKCKRKQKNKKKVSRNTFHRLLWAELSKGES